MATFNKRAEQQQNNLGYVTTICLVVTTITTTHFKTHMKVYMMPINQKF